MFEGQPQPNPQPQPDPSDPSYTCDGLECVAEPQPDPSVPYYTCDGLKCPEFPVFPQPDPDPQPQPPKSFKYCDDFFDPFTGFDWSKLFSDEFSTCTWKSD